MALSSRILAILENHGSGLSKREIAREMGLSGKDKEGLKETLKVLEESGKIERQDKRKYALAGQLPNVLVAEFYDHDLDGELLARPVNWQRPTPPPTIILAPGEADGGRSAAVGIGDKALIRLSRDEAGYSARIIKKLARDASSDQRLLGVVRKAHGRFDIVPTNRKTRNPWSLRPQDNEKVEDGDLVIVAPVRERRQGMHLVRLVERLGDVNAPRAASMIALVEHGIPQGFSDEELAQAEAQKPAVLGKRTDLRTLPLITIDPDDAKDFDDAIHARPDGDAANPGGWIVTVAIADVSAYVPGGSPLDRGALKRGNSVYLPDSVVPMLPERLSNDLCSLRPKEDRACMVVEMIFDAKGNKTNHKFMRALMRSAARLSYTQAQMAIDGQPDDVAATVLQGVLKPLWAAYGALKIARAKRNPLEIESSERKIRVNAQGKITSISKQERFDAHRLVEEFMVAANVCAAQTLEQKNCPLIYRVHDAPSAEKLHALSDFLRTIDMKWAKGERATTKRFNTLIQKSKSGKYADIINEMVLRSQMQAIYDTRNIGHFGLNLNQYAHFTSPIRRYADLTVHRALIRACKLGKDGASDAEQSQLKAIAQDITGHERRAMAAERDAAGRYIASYLAEHVGTTFDARISGVTRFGLFLRLSETGADGFVPIRQLGQEYFVHDEKAHALIGRESGGRYVLGQPVKAELLEATPLTGGLLFEMITPPTPGTRPGKHGKAHGGHSRKSAKHRRKRRS
jgi:ribonuclease R